MSALACKFGRFYLVPFPGELPEVLERRVVNGIATVPEGLTGALQTHRVLEHDSGHKQCEASGAVALVLETDPFQPRKKYAPLLRLTACAYLVRRMSAGYRVGPHRLAGDHSARRLHSADLGQGALTERQTVKIRRGYRPHRLSQRG